MMRRQQHQFEQVCIADLLPHTAPILMLKQILELAQDSITISAEIPADSAFADQHGRIQNVLSIEIMAQATALFNGLSQRQIQEPRKTQESHLPEQLAQKEKSAPAAGFLVSVKRVHLFEAYLRSGMLYTVHAQLYQQTAALSIFDCQLLLQMQLCAKARLAVMDAQQQAIEGELR